MEEQKAGLRPSDPLVDELSERVEEVIEQMGAKAAAETELAAEIDSDDGETDQPLE